MELTEKATCAVCKKKIAACRGKDKAPEFVTLRYDDSEPDGVREEWLCGCDECWTAYEEVA